MSLDTVYEAAAARMHDAASKVRSFTSEQVARVIAVIEEIERELVLSAGVSPPVAGFVTGGPAALNPK